MTTTVNQAAKRFLIDTPILDYNEPALRALSQERGWADMPEYERIGAIYDFVRNEILFGYNESDEIPASQVLADGYGQCNTKATLFMALLRQNGIPCRFRGFTIHKELQKGAITGLWYRMAPESIIHSWVEVSYDSRWVNLEGFILDSAYLERLQSLFPNAKNFCGYGADVPDLSSPPVEWRGSDTYIQKEGINHNFGVFDTPDDFYNRHGSNLRGLKKMLFKHIIRKLMNRNVARLRGG